MYYKNTNQLSLILVFLSLFFVQPAAAGEEKGFNSLILHADKPILNPVLQPGDHAILTVTAIRSNGSTVTIPRD